MKQQFKSAFVISGIYFAIGTVWLAASSQYVRLSLTDPAQIQLLFNQSLLRGFFILFSTCLLFFLIRYFTKKLESVSDQNLRLFEENPHPMFLFEQSTLRFLAVNNATIQKYGFTREEFLRMTIKEIRPPDQVTKLINREVNKAGFQSAGVWRHQTKAGKLLDVEISSHFMTYNGVPAELILAHDVTERLKYENQIIEMTNTLEQRVNERTHDLHEALQEQAALMEELETNNEELLSTNELLVEAQETIQRQARALVLASESKMSLVINNVKDFIWSARFKNHQFEVDMMSPSVEEIMGFTEQEYVKNPLIWFDVVPTEDKQILLNFLADIDKAPYHELYHRVFHHRSGQTRHIQSRVWVSESYEPGTLQLNGIMTDITERKVQDEEKTRLMEQLVLQNNDLIQFSYIASHNLRGPVASLMGILQLLDGKHGTDQQLMHKHLFSSVNKLDDVIKDITKVLDIRDHQSQPKEWVNIAEQVNNIIEVLRSQIENNQAQVDYLPEGSSDIFSIKSYQHSILYNLIANALKYRSPDRTPKIKITSSFTDTSLRLTISDNGLGIDLALYEDKIFKLYKRFHSHVEGKGLGLYLVKTQVTALRGTIAVSSQPDHGTEFIITFPKSSVQAEVVS